MAERDPFNDNMIEPLIQLYQEQTGVHWGLKEIRKMFLCKQISDCFVNDNPAGSDFGPSHSLTRKYQKERKLRYF